MPQTASLKLDETELPKGHLRKLNALRKSVGDDIGNRAFAQWVKALKKGESGPVDKTAELIEERIAALIKEKKISIPRGGYLLTRERGRVIITRTGKK